MRSFLTYKRVKELLLNFTKPLIIFVIRYTSKRRSLIGDFVFVYIGHQAFRFLLLYVKHGEVLES